MHSLPTLPRPLLETALLLGCRELSFSLFLSEGIIRASIPSASKSGDLRKQILKWKLCAWWDEPHLMPVVPRKQRCWMDLMRRGACSSLVVSELSIPPLPSGSTALPVSIGSFCSWVLLAPLVQCSLENLCSWLQTLWVLG